MADSIASAELADPGKAVTSSSLVFYPLTYLEEGDEVTVGRMDNGSFVVLPKDGAALLQRLESGASAELAADWFASEFGEQVDVLDFIDDIVELGFAERANVSRPAVTGPVKWMRLGKVIFSPAGLILYLVILAAFIVEIVRTPDLAPSYHNVFFTHYMTILVLVTFFGQMPLVLLHEAAHALAGRRLGLPSKLSIGRRLYYLVFLTTMDGLVAVPRRKRFLPILAGILTDLLVLAVLTLIAGATRRSDGSLPWLGAVALALAYLALLRILWQGWFFLQTDIYYLIVTVLGCVDLQTAAKQRLSNFFDRARGRQERHDPALWHPRDRAVSRWYSALIVVGYSFSILTLLWGFLPLAYRILSSVLSRFRGSYAGSTWGLLDSVVFLILTFGELAIAMGLLVRERRANGRAHTTTEI